VIDCIHTAHPGGLLAVTLTVQPTLTTTIAVVGTSREAELIASNPPVPWVALARHCVCVAHTTGTAVVGALGAWGGTRRPFVRRRAVARESIVVTHSVTIAEVGLLTPDPDRAVEAGEAVQTVTHKGVALWETVATPVAHVRAAIEGVCRAVVRTVFIESTVSFVAQAVVFDTAAVVAAVVEMSA